MMSYSMFEVKCIANYVFFLYPQKIFNDVININITNRKS